MTVTGAAVALPGAVGAGVSTTEGNEQLQQLIADVAKLAETVAVLAARPAPAPPPPQIIMQPAPAVRKRHFLSHLYIKCIILPRQARDEHRENSKKVPFSLSLLRCRPRWWRDSWMTHASAGCVTAFFPVMRSLKRHNLNAPHLLAFFLFTSPFVLFVGVAICRYIRWLAVCAWQGAIGLLVSTLAYLLTK